jgi:hypothetical protein
MKSIITSYLLQSRKSTLPYIGTFYHQWSSSKLDVVNKKLLPPISEINFHESSDPDAGYLANYIARKQNIELHEAKIRLDKYCYSWKEKLNLGDPLNLASIGTLKKNSEGHISLEKEDVSFWQPVNAQRVLHQDAAHNVLVGDKETTSTLMNQYYNGEIVLEKSHWGTWAIILLAIAACVLFFHFNTHSFSTTGIGNQKEVTIHNPPATYDVYKK